MHHLVTFTHVYKEEPEGDEMHGNMLVSKGKLRGHFHIGPTHMTFCVYLKPEL